jgi:hypothetical protein
VGELSSELHTVKGVLCFLMPSTKACCAMLQVCHKVGQYYCRPACCVNVLCSCSQALRVTLSLTTVVSCDSLIRSGPDAESAVTSAQQKRDAMQ